MVEPQPPIPCTFRDWMAWCLYDPEHGYYTKRRTTPRTGAGPEADFATSPTMHPFLAQCVAREAVELHRRLGAPRGFAIAEFGGGLGDLARDALAHLDTEGLQPEWIHIEASPDHREAQLRTDAGPGGKPAGQRVQHAIDLPRGFVGLVVAHEFLDALPVHLMERRKGSWAELCVAGDPPRLETAFPSRDALDATPELEAQEGQRVVANSAARRWFGGVGSRMSAGGVLVVDYGGQGAALWQRDPAWGTVRTFAAHADAGSPLAQPGQKDITASIDFAQCRAWAAAAGLEEVLLETQEAFLVRHGALEALNATPRAKLEQASSYLRLRQMLIPHAGGMGHAYWVALYEKGMG